MTKTKKIWLVVPINYEYNDEYFTRSGYESPKRAFDNLEDANKCLLDLSYKDYCDYRDQYSSYCYGNDEQDNKFRSALLDKLNISFEDDHVAPPLTKALFKKVMDVCPIAGYIVHSVEVACQDE